MSIVAIAQAPTSAVQFAVGRAAPIDLDRAERAVSDLLDGTRPGHR